ncbi:hypothetical protein C0Q70_14489 [Pomacea canaliculata]|uniref:Peptidase M28 domain-containing protein n=1 Tax=Pomacea canaliculata TaxID=400727 RepID=A0A2T7P058_POMCA|nr:hypothetical protein C0Q70_14489 [Pomacea canaliculata]
MAVMMEVARAMGQLSRTVSIEMEATPFYHVLFLGAEEYGLIGSSEWAEQYVKSLGARAVAYLNIDVAVGGTCDSQNNDVRATQNHEVRRVGGLTDTCITIFSVPCAANILPAIGELRDHFVR